MVKGRYSVITMPISALMYYISELCPATQCPKCLQCEIKHNYKEVGDWPRVGEFQNFLFVQMVMGRFHDTGRFRLV